MKRFVLAVLTALAACSPPAEQAAKTDEAPAAEAAGDGRERFYGRETFTLTGTMSGSETGTFTEHVRDWGRTRASIKATTVTAPERRRVNTRVVYSDAESATVNLDTGAVTIATNPFYDQVVQSMRGRDGVEVAREMMTQMGARATGERGNFAGHACDYWEIEQLGARSCVTTWGATLYNRTELPDLVLERTVTEVRMNDGGPDAAFQYDAARATRVDAPPIAPNASD
jgi:hypothetical protein